jgi:hypothetical protein
MTTRNRAILLIVIQCLLVSSIAAKYLYERATCPRVWVRTAEHDPELPMRGRYLALSPEVDVCGLTPEQPPPNATEKNWIKSYRVQLVARDGRLIAEDARDRLPRRDFQWVSTSASTSCGKAQASPPVNYFVPENARSPFPLKPGQELWVEATVPPSGPPRAIQLALSENGNWQVLKFE